MLSPEYIEQITKEAEKLAEQIHDDVLRKIIQRMMIRLGKGEDVLLSATDKWQLESMQEAGYVLSDIQAEIAKYTGLMQEVIQKAMESAGVEALTFDDAVYKAAGIETQPLQQSPHLQALMQRNYNATLGTWENFTKTMPSAGYNAYIKATDKAYNLASGGAVSYTEAVHQAVDEMAAQGVKVKYPSGHEDTIETATLRAVRTGISQATGEISMQRMIDTDWDIILVSAHLGARMGDGGENPGNHFWWQGKFYSRSGNDERFLPFSVTGYGTGEGLCGWNCRHSFGAGDGENNPYDLINLDSEENRKAYELSQKQRYYERDIRKRKRELIGLQEMMNGYQSESDKAEVTKEYEKKAYALSEQYKKYNAFCKDNNLKPLYDRTDVAEYTTDVQKDVNKAQRTVKSELSKADTGSIIKVSKQTDSGSFGGADTETFTTAVQKAKDSRPESDAWRVTAMTKEEFEEEHPGALCHITPGGSTIAVTTDGDIVSVCKKIDDKSVRGSELLQMAVDAGGVKLDSFIGNHEFYNEHGFTPISWTPFNEEFAPPGWKESGAGKEPIIFYKYTGKDTKIISRSEFLSNTEPCLDDKEGYGYDKAYALRDKTLEV